MKKKIIFLPFLISAVWLSPLLVFEEDLDAAHAIDSPEIILSEDFEGTWIGGAPELWSREWVKGSTDWLKASGGHDGHPSSAHGGSYNALLFYPSPAGYNYWVTTRLISPSFDFDQYIYNAHLTFWYTMEKFGMGEDDLVIYYRSSAGGSWILIPADINPNIGQWTKITVKLPDPGSDYYVCFAGMGDYGYGVCIDDVEITGNIEATPSPITPTPSPSPVSPTPTPSPITPTPGPLSPIIDSGDYNGDGTSDIGIFRINTGLWAIRGLTRVYFGSWSDMPVPGDYDGDTTTDIGIFRGSSGLWAIRGITRTYYGDSADIAVPLQYNPSSACGIGIFRADSGLWAVKGVTRVYFGRSGDRPVPGDYTGNSTKELAIFRSSSGLWAIRGVSRIYYGGSSDFVVPGDYNGDGTRVAGIFRETVGLWAIRGITRLYFGSSVDQPVPGDYAGSGRDDVGIFRGASGLWAIRGISRVYFGSSGDVPVTR
jgi:MAM domain-containing protein meprin/A5/mu